MCTRTHGNENKNEQLITSGDASMGAALSAWPTAESSALWIRSCGVDVHVAVEIARLKLQGLDQCTTDLACCCS